MSVSLLGKIFDKAATTPVPLSPRGFTIPWIQPNNAEAQMRAMGAVGTLFSIVNRTSNSTAQVKWCLYRTAKSGKDEDRVEVTSHAALDLWNKPNPFMPRQEFVEVSQQHIDLTGEAWWVVGRNPAMRSIPLELWPVRPDRMMPVPHATDYLAGYIYTAPDGERIPLELDEVIFLRMPSPLDPYRGMGPVQSILTDLDAVKYSAEWNRNFFVNSAEPGGIIEVPNQLSDDEFQEKTERWREQHRGVANAHRVAVIENGAKWVDRKYTMRDMQFTELRGVSREVIREAFGIPKFAVGDVEDVNRATAEAAKSWFAEGLTVPRLERIKSALNNDLLPLFGTTAQGLEFDYESPVPEDREAENAERTSKATAAKTLIDAGFDPAEVLKVVDLPEMAHKPRPAPVLPAPPEPPADDEPPAARHHRHQPRAAAESPADDVDLTKVQAAWQTALDDLVDQWDGVLDAQVEALADQITEAINDGRLAALATLTAPTDEAAQLLTAAMTALAQVAADQVVAEAADQDVTVQPVQPDQGALAETAAAVVALLAVGLALSAGREALRLARPGAQGRDVADQVIEHLESLTDAQPREHLGSALHGAVNAGRIATLKSAPEGALYASEKMDRNTCQKCMAIDGRWIANISDMDTVYKLYPTRGYVDCEGGDRCRGTIVGVWRPEQTGGDE